MLQSMDDGLLEADEEVSGILSDLEECEEEEDVRPKFSIGKPQEDIVQSTSQLYQVHIVLHHGRDLAAKDVTGLSDPYVKFKHLGKTVYKSAVIYQTLNPRWNQALDIFVPSLDKAVHVMVYDKDTLKNDDFLGQAAIDLSAFSLGRLYEHTLSLTDRKARVHMGHIYLSLKITASSSADCKFVNHVSGHLPKPEDTGNTDIWSSVLTVKLIGGNFHSPKYRNTIKLPELNVIFELGKSRYKSKRANPSLLPRWFECFDFNILSDVRRLEVHVFDKNTVVGSCAIDLDEVAKGTPRYRNYNLDDGSQLLLMLSMSSSIGTRALCDLGEADLTPEFRDVLVKRYSLSQSFTNLKDVGYLSVKGISCNQLRFIVHRAHGLATADIGGKSDPFCVLQLVNARLRTHTEFRTLNPVWNKAFTFAVKDVHAVLEVEVYDEDPKNRHDFLGKVDIPLLSIQNGERKWVALKDRKLQCRAKGQILLEMEVLCNPVKACIRTFNPAEEKHGSKEEKFKRQVFIESVMRLKPFINACAEFANFLESLFNWDSKTRTISAFIFFEFFVYIFDFYMFPLILVVMLSASYFDHQSQSGEVIEYLDDDDDVLEERSTLRERVQSVQSILSGLQNIIGKVASHLECVRNTFNFTQPFLSFLAQFVLSMATLLLYLVPLRYLLMIYGVHKFTKKLRAPFAIPNNELLDFLSRVPSEPQRRAYREYRPDNLSTDLAELASANFFNQRGRSQPLLIKRRPRLPLTHSQPSVI